MHLLVRLEPGAHYFYFYFFFLFVIFPILPSYIYQVISILGLLVDCLTTVCMFECYVFLILALIPPQEDVERNKTETET